MSNWIKRLIQEALDEWLATVDLEAIVRKVVLDLFKYSSIRPNSYGRQLLKEELKDN